MRRRHHEEPRCEHGVALGALDAYLAQLRGHARAAACRECWPEFAAADHTPEDGDEALSDLQNALDPMGIEQVERRLGKLLKRRRSKPSEAVD